jgi:hypothetical protein
VRVCSIRVDGHSGGIATDLFHDALLIRPMAPGTEGHSFKVTCAATKFARQAADVLGVK